MQKFLEIDNSMKIYFFSD